MKTSLTLPLLLLAVWIAPSALHAQGPQTFPLQWKEGITYLMAVSMEQSTDMAGQGEMGMSMSFEATLQASPGEQPGTTDLEMTYDSFEAKIRFGGQDIPGIEDQLRQMVGQSAVMTIDAEGNVVGVSGDVFDDLQAVQGMDEESLKQMMSTIGFYGSPEAGVSPGESWEFRHAQHNPMVAMALAGVYTYEGDEDFEGSRCARLSFEGAIEIETVGDEAAAEAAPGGADFREMMKSLGLEITESRVTGTSFYDFELGNVTRTDMEMDFTLSMSIPGVAEEAPATSVKSSMVQTLQVKGE